MNALQSSFERSLPNMVRHLLTVPQRSHKRKVAVVATHVKMKSENYAFVDFKILRLSPMLYTTTSRRSSCFVEIIGAFSRTQGYESKDPNIPNI